MTQFTFEVFFFICIVTICDAELKCGIHEVVDSCPSECELKFCPKSENYIQSCEKRKKCPQPACKCKFNFSRADNGTCISTRKCPAFPCLRPNEEYVSCPPYCPTDDCSQATPSGRCPLVGLILMTAECRPVCRCKQGYWRHKGVCVPFAECPNHDNNEETAQSPLWI